MDHFSDGYVKIELLHETYYSLFQNGSAGEVRFLRLYLILKCVGK